MTGDDTDDVEMMRDALLDAYDILSDVAERSGGPFESSDLVEVGLQLYRDRKTDFDTADLVEGMPWYDDDDDDENPFKVG